VQDKTEEGQPARLILGYRRIMVPTAGLGSRPAIAGRER